ncbi:MAG: CinA family protein [Treponema sp.]|jgi:PncC family amidohydrolase|nr:CinA family protein [Treponema sp.]
MTEANALIKRLAETSQTMVAAESCTGGLVADLLVQVPGASRVFWGSFVSYTVAAKVKMLGLEEDLIRRYGAVSEETACAMAQAALEQSAADMAVAVTGLAGPQGDGSDTPLGTVWIGTVLRGEKSKARRFYYPLSREEVRIAAAKDAIRELLAQASLNA